MVGPSQTGDRVLGGEHLSVYLGGQLWVASVVVAVMGNALPKERNLRLITQQQNGKGKVLKGESSAGQIPFHLRALVTVEAAVLVWTGPIGGEGMRTVVLQDEDALEVAWAAALQRHH